MAPGIPSCLGRLVQDQADRNPQNKTYMLLKRKTNGIVQFRLFENEIRPGVLQSSVQKRVLQEHQVYKAKVTDYILILLFLYGILDGENSLNVRLKHSRSIHVFDTHTFLYKRLRSDLSTQKFLSFFVVSSTQSFLTFCLKYNNRRIKKTRFYS